MTDRSLAYLAGIPVDRVKGLAGKRSTALKHAGILSVADLLLHVPRRYIDRSTTTSIAKAPQGAEVTVVGIVKSVKSRRVRKNLTIIEGTIFDGDTYLIATWFNQQFRVRQLAGEPEVALSGVIEAKRGALRMSTPEVDVLDRPQEALVTGRIVPVHPGVKGVSPGVLRRAIHNALSRSVPMQEPFSAELLERRKLVGRDQAFQAVHFPDNPGDEIPARRRLVFDELFRLQLALALRKRRIVEEAEGIAHPLQQGGLVRRFLDGLPFEPTPAQLRVIEEVRADMSEPHPMHRLLLGDVGAGKTVVAVAAMLTAVDGSTQGAVMAPTEVLAVQHYLSITSLLEGSGLAPAVVSDGMESLFSSPEGERPVRVGLLTSSAAELNFMEDATRDNVLEHISSGLVDVVIGTHALIQEGVGFSRLGVAVVDEQHRFGVHQRVQLRGKGEDVEPDLMIMTATPIPRTLSMTLYGDLDVSSIGADEMPAGRPQVNTTVLSKDQESTWVEKIIEEAGAGRQAFVVCPLVEDSPKLELASATAEHARLQDVFSGLRVGLLHGQLRPREKAEVMGDFRDQKYDVLVATTVIEVGIDIPHSTVMVIEDADRFGLSQLHQLRGRLSRGLGPNYCFLVADPKTEDGERRLAVMAQTDDGFRLAEEDLRIRGQGTVFGARQAGSGDLRVADLLRDAETLVAARREAFDLVGTDPLLEGHPGLVEEVRALLGDAVEWLLVS